MPAGTAVLPIERPTGAQFHGQFVLDPGSIAAGGSEAETVTVQGVAVGDVCFLGIQGAVPAGILVSPVRCTANTLAFNIENNSAGAVDLASLTWNYIILRGSSDRLGG